MTNVSDRGRIALLGACCWLLAACSQGKGESCQVARDCDDGLICKQDDGSRGQCIDPDEVEPDAGAKDAMIDPHLPLDLVEAGAEAGTDAATDAGFDAATDAQADAAGMDEDDAG